MTERIILASGSAIRARLLTKAGVQFEVLKPDLDEEKLKHNLRLAQTEPADQALLLSEGKALSISRQHDAWVIGADQMLEIGSQVLDKPKNMDEARSNLRALRGHSHRLLSATVVCRGSEIIWRHLTRPKMLMRNFSDGFLEQYLAQMGEKALNSVGGYEFEGLGAQLFSEVEGDYFAILGLSLLPLLDCLRQQKALRS